MRFVPAILAVMLAVPVARADDAAASARTARAFEIQYKDVEKAAALIKPLLGEGGSYSVQPSKNALIVTDTPANLDKIARVIAQYDAPPRQFALQLTLVAASRSDAPVVVADDLQEISRKLAGVLRYNSFERLGGITAEGNEGDSVVLDLEPGFHASFRFGEYDPVTNTVRVEELRLDRVQPAVTDTSSMMRTSLNLKVGQTTVVAASRQASSQRALMLVLIAQERGAEER